jgi:MFS family permease
VFYGWVVVGVVAFLLAASSGARFSFGVFLKPVAEAYGWERGALSLAITINLVLGGLLQPFAGWIVDRVGGRLIGSAGVALLGLSFVGLSRATELWQFYLLYGVIGAVGVAATSTVLSARLISSWFVARRSTALSFSSSGNAIGQLVVVPLATLALLTYGYAGGFLTVGLIALVLVAPMSWLLIRNEPSDMGLGADGVAGPRPTYDGLSLREAVRDPVFWQLSFGLAVCGVTMSFPSTHLMPYAMDMHVHEMVAGSALGLAGGLSLPAAIAVGWLGDRLGKGRVLAGVYALRGLTYVVLLFAVI